MRRDGAAGDAPKDGVSQRWLDIQQPGPEWFKDSDSDRTLDSGCPALRRHQNLVKSREMLRRLKHRPIRRVHVHDAAWNADGTLWPNCRSVKLRLGSRVTTIRVVAVTEGALNFARHGGCAV